MYCRPKINIFKNFLIKIKQKFITNNKNEVEYYEGTGYIFIYKTSNKIFKFSKNIQNPEASMIPNNAIYTCAFKKMISDGPKIPVLIQFE